MDKWYNSKKIFVKVHSDSTIRMDKKTYSVPSRTIGQTLSAYVYPDKIELMFGDKLIETISKKDKGNVHIDFKHVIGSLMKKPKAFEDYKYKECLYPNIFFRETYDKLKKDFSETKANKSYIEILNLAKVYTLKDVSNIIDLMLKANITPTANEIKQFLTFNINVPEINIREANLSDYDELIGGAYAIQ